MYLHWILCGDKCKYIDFRNTTNSEIHLLFLAAGLHEDKAFVGKRLVNVYIFLKQDDFKITLKDERKGSKDHIKVSLV